MNKEEESPHNLVHWYQLSIQGVLVVVVVVIVFSMLLSRTTTVSSSSLCNRQTTLEFYLIIKTLKKVAILYCYNYRKER